MYRKLPRSTDNILGYEIDGSLDHDEVEAIGDDIRRAIAAQGSPRMLIDLRSFPYSSADALWTDLEFGVQLEPFERIVVIGDAEWEAAAIRAIAAVTGAECRFFSRRNVDQAWEWITHGASRRRPAPAGPRAARPSRSIGRRKPT